MSATAELDGVSIRNLIDDRACPRCFETIASLRDPFAWVEEHRGIILDHVRQAGAVLLRGFDLMTADAFEQISNSLIGPLMEHREQSVYRDRVQHAVFTSTAYPADQLIFAHNEHSYSLSFPITLAFWCDTPASEGGETSLVDTRRVHARIAPAIRDRFERLGWIYACNTRTGDALSDPAARRAFEQYCAEERMTCEWKSPTRLKTSRVRPATIRHPLTGEVSWFNHVTFAHPSTLPAEIQHRVRAIYAEDDLPTNTCYGDGSPIEDETLAALREAYAAEQVLVAWRRGDLLLVDNIAVAHGRNPFAGKRRLLVVLGDRYTRVID